MTSSQVRYCRYFTRFYVAFSRFLSLYRL